MKNKKQFCFGAAVLALIAFFSVSCEADADKEEGKPWDGYEVKKMKEGSPGFYNIPNGIARVKTGDIYWYYIDAEADVTYSIIMNILFQIPASYAKNPAFGEWTGYKEDGTVFGKSLEEDDYNQPVPYYSPIDQRLYIRFEISGVSGGGEGYFVFGYTTD